MRAVMGALEAKTGGMEFNGENLREALLTIALMSVLVHARGSRLVPQLTAEENILLPTWTED